MAPLPLLLLALAAPPAPIPPEEEAKRNALARYALGVYDARTEHLTKAVRQFRIAAEQDPKAAAPHRELARAYADLGRDASAIREARAALALDATDFASARLLGKLLTEGHKYAEAAEAYRTAANDPDSLNRFAALGDLAHAATKANDPTAASRALDVALDLAARHRAELLKAGAYTAPELDRKRVELLEALGEAHTARQNFTSAVAAFEKARDLSLDKSGANLPHGVARIHWNLSKVFAEKGDTPAALRELEKYLAFLPASVAPYERYAEWAKKANPRADVRPALRAFQRANPKNTDLPWLVAAEATAAGEAGAFDLLLRDGGGEADAYRLLVKGHLAVGRYAELLALADKQAKAARPPEVERDPAAAVTIRPPPAVDAVARVRHLHAAVKAAKGATPGFIAQLETDARAKRTHAHDTLELVNFLATRDGQQKDLANALQTALAAAGRAAPAEMYELLFDALRERREWVRLRDVAEDAVKVAAFNTRITHLRAAQAAYAELGEVRKCLDTDDLLIAGVKGPYRAQAMATKAQHLAQFGKAVEALKLCEDIRAEFPTDAGRRQAALVEADVYDRKKEHAKAEGLLRDLLADDPDDPLVLNNLGYHLADQGRKLPEAEAMIRRAIELDRDARLRVYGVPDAESGMYLDSLGWVLLRRGETAKAVEVLDRASGLPDTAPDPTVWDHLGDALYRVGRRAEAKQAWKKAAELYAGTRAGREMDRLGEVKNRKLTLPD